jgi:hypothetical protein
MTDLKTVDERLVRFSNDWICRRREDGSWESYIPKNYNEHIHGWQTLDAIFYGSLSVLPSQRYEDWPAEMVLIKRVNESWGVPSFIWPKDYNLSHFENHHDDIFVSPWPAEIEYVLKNQRLPEDTREESWRGKGLLAYRCEKCLKFFQSDHGPDCPYCAGHQWFCVQCNQRIDHEGRCASCMLGYERLKAAKQCPYCLNRSDQGIFVGDVCFPCHEKIKGGTVFVRESNGVITYNGIPVHIDPNLDWNEYRFISTSDDGVSRTPAEEQEERVNAPQIGPHKDPLQFKGHAVRCQQQTRVDYRFCSCHLLVAVDGYLPEVVSHTMAEGTCTTTYRERLNDPWIERWGSDYD